MLQNGLHIVQRLIDSGFRRLQRGHFLIKHRHLFCIGRRQRRRPAEQQRFLPVLVCGCFQEAGDVAGKGFAQIMDQAHPDDLVQIGLGKGVPQEKGHQRQPPAMLRDAFVPPAGGIGMAGHILEPFCGM